MMAVPKKQRTSVLAMAATTSRFTPAAGLPDEDDFLRGDDGCAQARLQEKVSLDVSDQHQWQNEEKWRCRLLVSAILAATATITYQALPLGQPATDTYPSRRRALVYYYMNAVAFMASLVIIVLMLIRVGTLRQRHAGIKLALLGVALVLLYVPVGISRHLATAIYAAISSVSWVASLFDLMMLRRRVRTDPKYHPALRTTKPMLGLLCGDLALRTTYHMRWYKELLFGCISFVSFVASIYIESMRYELRDLALSWTTNPMRRSKELFFNHIHSVSFVASLVSITMERHPRMRFFVYMSSVTFALSSSAFLNLLRFLAAEQPAHTSKSPSALARVHMARQHRIQRNIQAHIHTLVVIIIATLIKGRTPQYSKCTHIQGCISTPNKKKAPSAHEHLLDHMLRSALSDRTYVRQCNLTEECSDKPRSNSSTPATNSSDDTTRDPLVQNKLNPDGENENHSGPDACVDDRDTSASKGQAKWYMATGAARHATGDSSLITNLVPLERAENGERLCVHAADGTPMPVLGRGSVVTPDVVLPDVYYVPGLLTNLVSVGQLAGLDYSVGFGRGACIVSSAAGDTVGRAHAGKDGLYEVEFLKVPLHMQ